MNLLLSNILANENAFLEVNMMEERSRKIVEQISSLPEPNLLCDMARHISETADVMEGMWRALKEYVAQFPGKRGVFIDPQRLMGSLPCPECGQGVNMGYFRILAGLLVEDSLVIKRKIVMGYITLHYLEAHGMYPERFWAKDEDLQDVIQTYEKDHPIDPLRERRDPQIVKALEAQIHSLTLEELGKALDAMAGEGIWNEV